MLLSTKNLKNFRVAATDETFGRVKDILFHDTSWQIRYFVLDTGTWLADRKVLVSPSCVVRADGENDVLEVSLTKERVEKSPSLAKDEPVSVAIEKEISAYYGWAPHGFDPSAATAAWNVAKKSVQKTKTKVDGNLRSVDEVIDYNIMARDGSIGHVDDFVCDDMTWALNRMIVDTRNWLPGKKVVVPSSTVEDIDWSQSEVRVILTKEEIKNRREFDPSEPVNRVIETRSYDYNARPSERSSR